MRQGLWLVVLLACRAEDVPAARLPLPPGGRVVAPMARVGARVETGACYSGRTVEALAAETAVALRADWGEVRIMGTAERMVLVGARGRRGLSGVVAKPNRAQCTDGELWVSIGIHEIPAETGATAAGPEGPRTLGQTKFPMVLSE